MASRRKKVQKAGPDKGPESMARRLPFLQLRGSTWYFRRAVPSALVPILGKKEILKRLSPNRKSAERLASDEYRSSEYEFDVARRQLATDTKAPTTDELSDTAIWELAAAWFAEAQRKDSLLTSVDTEETREWLAALSDPDDNTAPFHETRKLLKARGIDAEPGTPAFRRLCGLIREGMVQRERNRLVRFSAIPGLTNPRFADISVAVASPKPSVTFRELLARFRHHQSKPRSLKTVRKRIAQDREFCKIIGADTPIDKITRDDARHVQESVAQRRVVTTANAYIAAFTAVMQFAVNEGLLAASPGNKLKLRSEGITASELRLPFTNDELQKMFSSALPEADAHPSKRWLPVLGLLTGARLGELAQLRRDNILNQDGVTLISIQGQIKTAASKRMVPVHPELKRLGFLDFINEVTPDARLFPELRMSSDGYLSEEFSRIFGKHLRSLGIDTPRRRSFHCLRHNYRRALLEAGVSLEITNALCGWTSKGREGAAKSLLRSGDRRGAT
jgi:integrase